MKRVKELKKKKITIRNYHGKYLNIGCSKNHQSRLNLKVEFNREQDIYLVSKYLLTDCSLVARRKIHSRKTE